MALTIEDAEVERLAAEVAQLAHESETEAIRRALEDRKKRLEAEAEKPKRGDLRQFLEREVWPHVPPEVFGKPVTREEVEDILGIGPDGF
jgi:antitoxin VapB